jgi:outer membrane cobalamin receptor
MVIVMLFCLFSNSYSANIQKLIGHVYVGDSKGNKKPLAGANVHFPDDKKHRVVTDAQGSFSIVCEQKELVPLVASCLGFVSDTLYIAQNDTIPEVEFILQEGIKLSEVVVNATKSDATIAKLSVQKTETINSEGLMKLACCNLAQSFENSATVTVGYADAISGARQIQMLGLSGIYCQTLNDNVPTLRGLSTPYGWNQIPGPWLESIQISKGSSSVVNGYEAITGQINLEFKKPDKVEDFYADLYSNNVYMNEGNITAAKKISDKLWTNLFIHGSLDVEQHDFNHDHFMDMPRVHQYSILNQWLYIDPVKKIQSRTSINFQSDDENGGQSPKCHKADVYYVTTVINNNFNIYNKTGIFIGKPGQSLAWINSATYHSLNGYFGAEETYKLYNGTQNSLYSNLIFSSWIGNTNNQYTTGISFQYDDYQTSFKDRLNNVPLTPLNRTEVVPGAYFQYTWTPTSKFTLIAGVREDYNSFAGWLFTPRTNLRYELSKNLIFRASVGRGFRTPNAIPDNFGSMASARNFDVAGIKQLKIERAWNFGGNATLYIPVNDNKKITISMDYFHTSFENQAIADIDRNPNSVYFYNSTHKSFANAWQTDISFSPITGFDILTAFRYNQTMVTLTDGVKSYKEEQAMSPRYRGLLNLTYATKFRKWVFDFTTQLNGPERIPSMTGYSGSSEQSPVYPLLSAQVTKHTKRLDFYLGGENLTNYRQYHPVINGEDPFVKGFDASLVWGPVLGKFVYGGIRLWLGKMY